MNKEENKIHIIMDETEANQRKQQWDKMYNEIKSWLVNELVIKNKVNSKKLILYINMLLLSEKIIIQYTPNQILECFIDDFNHDLRPLPINIIIKQCNITSTEWVRKPYTYNEIEKIITSRKKITFYLNNER